MKVVPEGEKVAVAFTLFHYDWEDLTGLPSQFVVPAPRSALLAAPPET